MRSAMQWAMPSITARSHDVVIHVYDETGNVIETHAHNCDFKSGEV